MDRHARPAPRPLTDLAAAIGFLTLLPVGRSWPEDRPPRSTGWYPAVGALLGAIGAGIAWAGRVGLAVPFDARGLARSFVVGAAVVVVWALLTRFLHWDGIADAFDGLWGGSTPERRLEIMRDSRIGSFGAAAMLMAALLQVSSAASIVASGRLWVLVAAPMLGRLAAAVAAWALPPARRDGLGLTAMERPEPYDVGIAVGTMVVLVIALALVDPVRGLVVLLLGLAAGVAVPALLSRPVGGMTGDLFGATVLLVETVVLLCGALLA